MDLFYLIRVTIDVPRILKKKNNESLSIYFSEITERERGEEDFHRWNQPCGKKRLDRPRKKS